MRKILLIFLCNCFSACLLAQQNCNNPLQLDICPSVLLTGQTNAGMLDDPTATCNLPGEDVVYEIHAPNGVDKFFYSIINATSPLKISISTTCTGGTCQTQSVSAGNTHGTFSIPQSFYYYVWIDAPGTVYYSISFGADTATNIITVPNTQGNLQFDATPCATPVFLLSKPFFQVIYNGVYKTDPMTLSPLNIAGNLCVKTFFKNTTGIEGIRKFVFHFNPLGFPIFNAIPGIVPGNYNSGNWIATSGGDSITFTFNDAAGIGKGDFGLPSGCLEYEFCFNVVPISNLPSLTNVRVNAYSDGFGAGYTGIAHLGCCPIPYPNCANFGGGIGGGGGTTAFGFAFDDPGTLPVEMISFEVFKIGKQIKLSWSTASEINNDYFTIQRSTDAKTWGDIYKIDGAGNSNTMQVYQYIDPDPQEGVSFYRIKQTDFDGSCSFSAVKKINTLDEDVYAIPNPANNVVRIYGSDILQLSISSMDGKTVNVKADRNESVQVINTNGIEEGIYILSVVKESGSNQRIRLSIKH